LRFAPRSEEHTDMKQEVARLKELAPGAGRPLPTISVVTPSLNQAEHVEAALRSVLTQGYGALEYVVIDGGSTDGSTEIIRRYEEDLAFWASEHDRGHAHALNKGFAHTSGEIMCWINSSDLHYRWTLETVSQIFQQVPQVEWIMGMPSKFDLSGAPKSVGASFCNMYDFLAGDYLWIQQESVFWRRSLWERAGARLNEDLTCAADLDLWLRFFREAKLYHVSTILAGYRVHDDRLGAKDRYAEEAETLVAQFTAQQDRRTARRACVIRAVGHRHGQAHTLAKAMEKLGICPWYRHPQVVFDFDDQLWKVRRGETLRNPGT